MLSNDHLLSIVGILSITSLAIGAYNSDTVWPLWSSILKLFTQTAILWVNVDLHYWAATFFNGVALLLWGVIALKRRGRKFVLMAGPPLPKQWGNN